MGDPENEPMPADAPDTGPADDQAKGGKPGDRPLPPAVPAGTDTDQERRQREAIIRHDADDDANKDDG